MTIPKKLLYRKFLRCYVINKHVIRKPKQGGAAATAAGIVLVARHRRRTGVVVAVVGRQDRRFKINGSKTFIIGKILLYLVAVIKSAIGPSRFNHIAPF